MSFERHEPNSITVWIDELKKGSEGAANELWKRYFEQLVSLAKKKLGNSTKRMSDEEDVALNVFLSLCEGASQGRFCYVDNRDDLWKLLVVMTKHKALNQLRDLSTKKRGGGKVRGNSIVKDWFDEAGVGFDVFFDENPSPDSLLEIEEEIDRLLSLLPDESYRRIAMYRLQGYSIDETADKIGLSSRSVKRKLAIVRESWISELPNDFKDR